MNGPNLGPGGFPAPPLVRPLPMPAVDPTAEVA